MIRFPNAKINLGLDITARRADGYHDIATVFYPIPLCDILEVVVGKHPETSLTVSGNRVDCPMEKNLVYKAYMAMSKLKALPPVDIYLHKVIPDGAGLGGGSSDASNMLVMLNDMFSLGMGLEDLAHVASSIGADCPFFIYDKPLMATGIGDVFTRCDVDLSGKYLLLVKPDVYVSTKDAYSRVVPKPSEIPIDGILQMPVAEWRKSLKNDFELSVFALFPELGVIKDKFYEYGAEYASMSGSGSSIFGIFENVNLAEQARKVMSIKNSWVLSL